MKIVWGFLGVVGIGYIIYTIIQICNKKKSDSSGTPSDDVYPLF